MKKYTFFWNNRTPFSNWYPSKFTWGDFTFTRGEQYMMFRKAIVFGDLEIADLILETDNPAEQQKLGRRVKNYNDKIWAAIRYDVMVEGLYCKFSQNDKLKRALFDTAGTTLVEASPYDRIWGIGLGEDDPRAQDESTWLGQNLLGQVLTQVREQLISEENQ